MRPRDFITFIGRGAGGCSLAARAQQPALPVIEFLGSATPQSMPTHAAWAPGG